MLFVFCSQLKSLGYMCGLVSENGPDSEELNRTVDLLAGLGAERPETGNHGNCTICHWEVLLCFCSVIVGMQSGSILTVEYSSELSNALTQIV